MRGDVPLKKYGEMGRGKTWSIAAPTLFRNLQKDMFNVHGVQPSPNTLHTYCPRSGFPYYYNLITPVPIERTVPIPHLGTWRAALWVSTMGAFTSTHFGSRNSQVGYAYHAIWLTSKFVNKILVIFGKINESSTAKCMYQYILFLN